MWMYSDFFAFPFSLAPAAFGVLCWSSQLQTSSLCIAFFLSRSVPPPSVLQLWLLLCDLYDISDSAHLFLLLHYFDCLAIYLSALCLMRSCVFSLLTPRMGARLLNVYSNVFHQWCRARWTECNHMLDVFIKLWIPLFLLHISLSVSLCLLLQHIALWRAFCECLFSPLGCLSFFLKFILNRTP